MLCAVACCARAEPQPSLCPCLAHRPESESWQVKGALRTAKSTRSSRTGRMNSSRNRAPHVRAARSQRTRCCGSSTSESARAQSTQQQLQTDSGRAKQAAREACSKYATLQPTTLRPGEQSRAPAVSSLESLCSRLYRRLAADDARNEADAVGHGVKGWMFTLRNCVGSIENAPIRLTCADDLKPLKFFGPASIKVTDRLTFLNEHQTRDRSVRIFNSTLP